MRRRSKTRRSDRQFVLDGLESRLLLSAAIPTLHYKPLTAKTIKAPFVPTQIRQAFQINDVSFDGIAGDGSGETIAIVNAYAMPTLASDTANFNSAFDLPQFNTAGGPTLTVEGQDGTTDDLPTQANQGWSIEESLDVEWATCRRAGSQYRFVRSIEQHHRESQHRRQFRPAGVRYFRGLHELVQRRGLFRNFHRLDFHHSRRPQWRDVSRQLGRWRRARRLSGILSQRYRRRRDVAASKFRRKL